MIELIGYSHLSKCIGDVGEKAFGHIEVHKNKLKLKWTGRVPSDSIIPWDRTQNMLFE